MAGKAERRWQRLRDLNATTAEPLVEPNCFTFLASNTFHESWYILKEEKKCAFSDTCEFQADVLAHIDHRHATKDMDVYTWLPEVAVVPATRDQAASALERLSNVETKIQLLTEP